MKDVSLIINIVRLYIIGMFAVLVFSAYAQEATESVEVTPASTATTDLSVSSTPGMPDVTNTPVPTLGLSSTVESNAVVTPTATPVTPEVTDEVDDEITATAVEVIPDSTVTPEITEEVGITITSPAELPVTFVPTVSPIVVTTPLATSLTPIHELKGVARFQGEQVDNAGIEIIVYDFERNLLGRGQTDSAGRFDVILPGKDHYWLIADAPLFQRTVAEIGPDVESIELVLIGGDINGDGCIGSIDLDLLVQNFNISNTPETDITKDGITDLADLAILTGNFDADCVEMTVNAATPTPLPTFVPPVDAVATEVQPTSIFVEITPELEATAELEVEVTIESEATNEVELTGPPTSEAITPEAATPLPGHTPTLPAEATEEVENEDLTPTVLRTVTVTLTPTLTIVPTTAISQVESTEVVVPEATAEMP